MKTLCSIAIVVVSSYLLPVKSTGQCAEPNRPGVHIVQHGESLYRISRIYKVKVADICRWNNMKESDILPDCLPLYVSKPGESAPAPDMRSTPDNIDQRPEEMVNEYQPTGYSTYEVQPNDNLPALARKFGYTYERFLQINKLTTKSVIRPGDILRTSHCPCVPGEPELQPKWAGEEQFVTPEKRSKPTDVAPTPYGPQENTSSLYSRRDAPYMTADEITMLNEINMVRTDPQGYIKRIEEFIAYNKKNGEFGNSIATAKELIAELQTMTPVRKLEPMECVYQAAQKHGIDQRKLKEIDHVGTDGSWPWDRVRRECPSLSDGAENLVGGPSDIRRAVIFLLVDDGIDDRGHRKTMLDPNWKYAACYKVGTVGKMPNCWIQKFAN